MGYDSFKSSRKKLGLGRKLGYSALIAAASFGISTCKNPLQATVPAQEESYTTVIEQSSRSIADRLEEESSTPLSQEELDTLETIISENLSGHTTYHLSLPFTLGWDSDTIDREYNLYARSRDSERWMLIAVTGGSGAGREKSFEVSELPFGIVLEGAYEFGVRSVDYGGLVSEMHKSTDSDAQPSEGWYGFVDSFSPADVDMDRVTTTDELIDFILAGGYTDYELGLSVDDWYLGDIE